jgi:pimeloyl-ACP methyl ester carboxylesterase
MHRTPAFSLLLLFVSATALAQAGVELSDCRINAGPGTPGIAARCGQFTRPLNPADPDSETIELRVAVVPAQSLDPAPDAFVPIAGGPGGSSIKFYAAWAPAFERVRKKHDILLVDQRGTGDSAPMTCDVDEDIVSGVYNREDTLKATRDCLAALPYDPRFFTTSVAVTDLEALRAALGYAALDLYGSSYGTRVAQHFARRFPGSTRAVIIDGVVPPQVPLGPEIATESQRALDSVFDRCGKDPDCSASFPDLRGDFQRLSDMLSAGPLDVDIPDPLTGEPETVHFGQPHMAAAIRLLLYDARSIALIPLFVHEAATGNIAPLTAEFQMANSALSDELAIGMHNAVVCTEDIPFIDKDEVDQASIDASYLGPDQLDALMTICSIWPRGVLDDDLLQPLSTDKPVLLLSGDADPITPPRYAELAASRLTNAWLLTGKNQGHGLGIVGCVPRIIGSFIDAAKLGDGVADCLDDSFAMPFFLDFAGPKP